MNVAVRIVETKHRKCGERHENAAYAIGGGGDGSKDGALMRFNRINPPVPYQVKVHRGPRIVDGNAILGRMPLEDWWTGSSAETEQRKSGEAWAQDTFGMTIQKRLTTGECVDAQAHTPDEALAVLAANIKWSNRIGSYFQALSLGKVQELPRVAVHYSRLHESLLAYASSPKIGCLMEAQAAVWRIAYHLPPTKRHEVVPNLTRILAVMNLKKDALAMQKMFGV